MRAIENRPWNTSDEILQRVFCAALTGICANPAFCGPLFQQSAKAAVEFADAAVQAFQHHQAFQDRGGV